jgi:hypothetical protein
MNNNFSTLITFLDYHDHCPGALCAISSPAQSVTGHPLQLYMTRITTIHQYILLC